MPYALRTHTCPDCGVEHKRRGPVTPAMRCHPCAIKLSAEVNRQLHEKSGPYWDTWVFANATAARRVASRHQVVAARRAS